MRSYGEYTYGKSGKETTDHFYSCNIWRDLCTGTSDVVFLWKGSGPQHIPRNTDVLSGGGGDDGISCNEERYF